MLIPIPDKKIVNSSSIFELSSTPKHSCPFRWLPVVRNCYNTSNFTLFKSFTNACEIGRVCHWSDQARIYRDRNSDRRRCRCCCREKNHINSDGAAYHWKDCWGQYHRGAALWLLFYAERWNIYSRHLRTLFIQIKTNTKTIDI